MPRVLLMEADGALAGRLRARLARDGIETTVAASAAEGLNLVAGDSFDLAAADDGLPDLDGARLVERLRRIRSGLPVMLLTSSAGPRRRIRYYRLGANDVMVKPFWPDEFAARVRNLLDLTGKAFIGPIRAGDLTIDPDRRTADMAGQPLALTPTEFDLLLYFARNEGRTLTRDEIMERVWGYTFSAGRTNLVDVYVRYLRQKIDRAFGTKYFHTVRGFGYRFAAGKAGAERREREGRS